MNDQQLLTDLIQQGESQFLEFKETVRKDEVAKVICSFLNSKGGTLLIGVTDEGNIIGLPDAQYHEEELKQYLFTSIIPEAPVTVSYEEINNKFLLLIKVWNGSKPPYVYNNNIYLRRKDQTVKASSNDISKLIVERQKTEFHWERQPALGIDLDDLDYGEILKTIHDLQTYRRGKAFVENDVEDFLSYYGLYQNGILTNAAVVLFAKEPTKYLPQCRIRLTVFNNSKSSDSFSYDKFFEGNLFRNIEDIIQFFDVNIASKSKFSDTNWLREDTAFPKLAIREGLMNAVIHRDYSSVSGTVAISFYPNRLEITNSGELYGGYTPKSLTKNHMSVPRNPDIAQIFFLRQLIEKIGRGTIKMIEDCEAKGYPEPIWESDNGVTILTFRDITVAGSSEVDTINDAVNDTVNDAVNDAVKKDRLDPVSDTVIDALSDTVKIIAANPDGVSMSELMRKTGKSSATVKRYLQILKHINFIRFNGAAKTGKYIVIKPEQLNKKK